MGLYEHLPFAMRRRVDDVVKALASKPWPLRFLTLVMWLDEELGSSDDSEPWLLLQQWAALVTATLERLPPDSTVIECLGLMSISYNDEWRAQALEQMERDPTVLDRLLGAYPGWHDVVESLSEAGERRPIKRGAPPA